MKSLIKSQATKQFLLVTCLLSLGGCVSGLKQMDLSMPESATAEPGMAKLSVEQLLSQARSQSTKATSVKDIYLQFNSSHRDLSGQQKNQVLDYALNSRAPIVISCAPSRSSDPINAAAKAILRCQQISQFLQQHAIHSDMRLAPKLSTDQVRLHQ